MPAKHRMLRPSSTWLLLLGAAVTTSNAIGAELKIATPRSMWTVLRVIGPQFESAAQYRLSVSTDIAATLADRIIAGEPFDVFIGPPAQIDLLVKARKVKEETRTPIARSGIGMEVRAGSRKPDISSVEAFKRTLLTAKSIGYLKQVGTSGAYLHDLFERLGISDAIKSRIVRPDTDIVSELVAKGEVEIGMVVATQIMTTAGVELVGLLPAEIQYYVRWSGGVVVSSAAPDVAQKLIDFLRSPAASSVIKAQGMEPE